MEELNNVIENYELMEVLPTEGDLDVFERDMARESGNILGITLAVTAVVGLGIYGYKKYVNWRASKKESEVPVNVRLVVDCEDVETEELTTQED